MRTDDLKSRTIYVKFDIGDIVYLKVCADRYKGMVTCIHIRPTGNLYGVTWEGGDESSHYDIELTGEFIPDYDANGDDE